MKEQVWQKIAPLIGGGDYLSLEEHTSELARTLDQRSGVDGFQVTTEGLRTVSTRVQFIPSTQKIPWDSYTVRLTRKSGAETELKKRLAELNSPTLLHPHWIVQAYCDETTSEVRSAAAITALDLYSYLAQEQDRLFCHHLIKVRENRSDGNLFLVIPWDDLACEQRRERFTNLDLSSFIYRAQ